MYCLKKNHFSSTDFHMEYNRHCRFPGILWFVADLHSTDVFSTAINLIYIFLKSPNFSLCIWEDPRYKASLKPGVFPDVLECSLWMALRSVDTRDLISWRRKTIPPAAHQSKERKTLSYHVFHCSNLPRYSLCGPERSLHILWERARVRNSCSFRLELGPNYYLL